MYVRNYLPSNFLTKHESLNNIAGLFIKLNSWQVSIRPTFTQQLVSLCLLNQVLDIFTNSETLALEDDLHSTSRMIKNVPLSVLTH